MRELTKSVMSYTWAMSVFGVQQMVSLFIPRQGRSMADSVDAINNVTGAATEQLGETMQSTFRAGDQLQRGVVDLMFGAMMMGAWCPDRWTRNGRDAAAAGTNGGAGARPAGPPPGTYPGTAGTPPPSPQPPRNGKPPVGPAPRGAPSWSWGPPKGAEPAAPPAPPPPPMPVTGQATGWGPMP